MAWVYKPDGSKQCSGVAGSTTAQARSELSEIVGADNIQDLFRVGLFVIQVCGLPTGISHAANLTEEGITLLATGIVGSKEWAPWPFSDDPVQMRINDQHPLLALVGEPGVPFPMRAGPEVPFPREFNIPEIASNVDGLANVKNVRPTVIPDVIKKLTSVSGSPANLRDLIGYKLRIVRAGDADPLIFYFGRVNIHLDNEDRIQEISFH